MKQILFSPLGTTDPVRGLRDGGMLHIVRHYRPEKIIWYYSKEIWEKEEKDHRIQRAIDDFLKRTPGYQPEIISINGKVDDASDFDRFGDDFERIVRQETEAHPEAEILLNLSSGTPQMKMTLALLVMDLRFHCKGVQVKSPERSSSKAERTNDKRYDFETELELNEDFDDDAENRCEEPQLLLLQRESERAQIKALLDHYDYQALASMKASLPSECRTLISHLAKRAEYEHKKAEEIARSLNLPFPLYPRRQVHNRRLEKSYTEISEYLLCLKLMQKAGNLTSMVIRLNPLILKLQQDYLYYCCGFDYRNIIQRKGQHEYVSRDKIRAYSGDLEEFLDIKYSIMREADINIVFCNYVIEFFGKKEEEVAQQFVRLGELNAVQRNLTAHTLNNTTEEDIKKYFGLPSAVLIQKLEEIVQVIYQDICSPKLFSIYDTCNEYLYSKI